jgi:hypothetical protein
MEARSPVHRLDVDDSLRILMVKTASLQGLRQIMRNLP